MRPIILLILLLIVCPATSTQSAASSSALEDYNFPNTVVFEKYQDATEKAFYSLVPKGWECEGGIVRPTLKENHQTTLSVEPRLDFLVKNNAQGSAVVHWVPQHYYVDLSESPMGQLFPDDQDLFYMGIPVQPYKSPHEFLLSVLIPDLHPLATTIAIKERRNVPQITTLYSDLFKHRFSDFLPEESYFTYEAEVFEVHYEEESDVYVEKVLLVMENRGKAAAGVWSNQLTIVVRASAKETDLLQPIFQEIVNSFKLDKAWLTREMGSFRNTMNTTYHVLPDLEKLVREAVEFSDKVKAAAILSLFPKLSCRPPKTCKSFYT